MRKLASIMSLAGGIWLVYLGHQRRESLPGKADSTLSNRGSKIDGSARATSETQCYGAGAGLTLGSMAGPGLIRE
jgi:hypothetical protein